MRKNILAGAAALALSTSAAMADGHTGTITATLTIDGECEVQVLDISAETENFRPFGEGDVTLDQGEQTLDTDGFDAVPDHIVQAGIDDTATIAILCSASASDHELSLSAGDAVLVDGDNSIVWRPRYREVGGTFADIAIDPDVTDETLQGDPLAAKLYEFQVDAVVERDDITEALPGEAYTQTIGVTVSFAVPAEG